MKQSYETSEQNLILTFFKDTKMAKKTNKKPDDEKAKSSPVPAEEPNPGNGSDQDGGALQQELDQAKADNQDLTKENEALGEAATSAKQEAEQAKKEAQQAKQEAQQAKQKAGQLEQQLEQQAQSGSGSSDVVSQPAEQAADNPAVAETFADPQLRNLIFQVYDMIDWYNREGEHKKESDDDVLNANIHARSSQTLNEFGRLVTATLLAKHVDEIPDATAFREFIGIAAYISAQKHKRILQLRESHVYGSLMNLAIKHEKRVADRYELSTTSLDHVVPSAGERGEELTVKFLEKAASNNFDVIATVQGFYFDQVMETLNRYLSNNEVKSALTLTRLNRITQKLEGIAQQLDAGLGVGNTQQIVTLVQDAFDSSITTNFRAGSEVLPEFQGKRSGGKLLAEIKALQDLVNLPLLYGDEPSLLTVHLCAANESLNSMKTLEQRANEPSISQRVKEKLPSIPKPNLPSLNRARFGFGNKGTINGADSENPSLNAMDEADSNQPNQGPSLSAALSE